MKPFGCISFTFEKVFFLKSNLQNIEVADKNERVKFCQKIIIPQYSDDNLLQNFFCSVPE